MGVLRFFYYVHHLCQENIELAGITILGARVEDEADALETLDSAFVFG